MTNSSKRQLSLGVFLKIINSVLTDNNSSWMKSLHRLHNFQDSVEAFPTKLTQQLNNGLATFLVGVAEVKSRQLIGRALFKLVIRLVVGLSWQSSPQTDVGSERASPPQSSSEELMSAPFEEEGHKNLSWSAADLRRVAPICSAEAGFSKDAEFAAHLLTVYRERWDSYRSLLSCQALFQSCLFLKPTLLDTCNWRQTRKYTNMKYDNDTTFTFRDTM